MKMTAKLASLALVLGLTSSAYADTTVKVDLWDKGDMPMGGMMDMGFGMAGMHGDMSMAMMGVKIDQLSIPAGKVTFEATNSSTGTIHEMLVAPIASMDAVLPYNKNEERINEEEAKYLGEVSELEPGKSGALTVDMKPGLYLLFCNIPGHYASGMWTTIEVK